MKLVTEMPKTGSFVAIWNRNGVMLSDNHRYIKGVLHTFNGEEGEWYADRTSAECYVGMNVQFVIEG
ncbi:hypothetical protein UGMREWDR_CDS0168 [Aeromonas phage GomatiRiver_11]|nr:hypothetical protein OBDJBBDK_00159 [Aeromonas phage AhFM11]WKW84335.1 hypothetical protein UGMREWDR_CDS0168 [Aeromonas phage GomatiRiver_11]